MTEYAIHYYIFDQKSEVRTMIIEANTLQDAIVVFNVNYSKGATLVHAEQFGLSK
jgi:hypothetical protein